MQSYVPKFAHAEGGTIDAELGGCMPSVDHVLRLPWDGDKPLPGDLIEHVGGRVFYTVLEARQQSDGLLLMCVRRSMKRPEPAPGGRVWMLPD